MNMEWTKIIRNKKVVGMLVFLLAFQLFFYLYTIENKQFYDGLETYGSQEQFEKDYYAYVDKTIKHADSMGSISIFGELDSFSKANLEKTKYDFLKMINVKPVLFEDEYFIRFFEYSYTHIFVLLAGIIVVLTLVDEKKPGIRNIIFASKNGRSYLFIHKASALFLWSGCISLLFYGGTLLVSAFKYEHNLFECFLYPMQSIRMFTGIPWKINIGTFLLLFWLYRTITLFVIIFIIWTILFCIDNLMVSVGSIGTIGLISFVLYILIPHNHPLNILYYGNLWYQMASNDFITKYQNIYFFSNAVGKEVIVIATWGIWLVVLFVLNILMSEYKYPCKSIHKTFAFTEKTKALFRKIKRIYRKTQEKLSLQALELYKILITQKGLLIYAAIIFIIFSSTEYKEQLTTGSQKLFVDFVSRYEGVPSEASYAELIELEKFLEELEAGYVQAMEDYANEKITERELWAWNTKYDLYESERYFLKTMKGYNGYLSELSSFRGIEGWYVNHLSYNHLFMNKNAIIDIVILLGIVLLCSGIFAYDKQYGVESMVRASAEGRQKLFKIKMVMSIVLSCVIAFVAIIFEMSNTTYLYKLSGLTAPVQSLSLLSFVPFSCSIGTFIVIVYALKTLTICFIGMIVAMLSIFVKQKVAIGIAIILCVPDLLSMIGIPLFENVSIVRVLSTSVFMLETKSFEHVLCILIGIGVVAITSVFVGHKKWCYS